MPTISVMHDLTISGNSTEVCLEPNCVTSAAAFLDSMDWSVDPCEDFYDFVCGSWIDKAMISEVQSARSIIGDLTEQNAYEIHKALILPKEEVTVDEQMAKDFYLSKCTIVESDNDNQHYFYFARLSRRKYR